MIYCPQELDAVTAHDAL